MKSITVLFVVCLFLIVQLTHNQQIKNCEFIDYFGRYYDFKSFIDSNGYQFGIDAVDYYWNICTEESACSKILKAPVASCVSYYLGLVDIGDLQTMTIGELPNSLETQQEGAQLNYTSYGDCPFDEYGARSALGDAVNRTTFISLLCKHNAPNTVVSFTPIGACNFEIVMEGNGACAFQNESSSMSSEDNNFQCHFLGTSVAISYPNNQIQCKGVGQMICNSAMGDNGQMNTCSTTDSVEYLSYSEVQCFGDNFICSSNGQSCGFKDGSPVQIFN
ncbi:hypothetical protein DLAC_05992 [Tieghemostelium lacteum]|uniref:MRH domain-containing protein n=1 Tax=Tieghemostelium lacteum TaxID=361077 RepID=A0A151ZHI3_TIELA|nr:hypothetical protein DLAC_05992 [Tieghemostelium lacteum]|eukprot:KYQ93324.1 hypothetical protein DLAC_05992 [Tieghemostelium lacteum]